MKSFPAALNPLFSCFVALYTLILLCLPSFFLNLIFSPVLISAGVLLLSLLRFGAAQKGNRNLTPRHDETESATDFPLPDSQTVPTYSEDASAPVHDPDPDSSCRGSFLEWDVGAPLEVIHEACCEGEDAPDDAVSSQKPIRGNNEDRRFGSLLQKYPSLSRYYPETDSDSESDSDSDSSISIDREFPAIGGSDFSPEKACFLWEGGEIDQEKDGLIEIQLDGGKRKVLEELEFHTEEDNFIEIEI